jgi:two-component system sensor histidine kinase KdpD
MGLFAVRKQFPVRVAWRLLRTLISIALVLAMTVLVYALHVKAFIAGFVYLLLILPIAFKWGLIEASAASVLACLCLDDLYAPPIFSLRTNDPQDWVALFAFETVVIVVSELARRLRRQAAETAAQQASVDRLYKMSCELLRIDRSELVGAQLASLIAETFNSRAVALWDAQHAKICLAGEKEFSEEEVRTAYSLGRREDIPESGRYLRPLLLGGRTLGAVGIAAGAGIELDSRTADAIASLVAIALERERSFLAEGTAEASRQSEQLRSAVLDGLAHAYKTPLATIQTASSGLLELDQLAGVEKELVTMIQNEVEHLTSLTTQALETARMDDSRLKIRRERIPLKSFLQSDWQRLAQGLRDHGLNIEAEKASRFVWADRKLLQMALAQFLDNASKYAEPASPVSLRVTATDHEAIFSVHNWGSYILPEDRERIFQRFYRSPESRHVASGSGIGLAVVKQIADAHQGHVWMESDKETGTTFYLRLPAILGRDS